MTNGEKYKTAKERADAFFKQRDRAWSLEDAFAWLDLEAEEDEVDLWWVYDKKGYENK